MKELPLIQFQNPVSPTYQFSNSYLFKEGTGSIDRANGQIRGVAVITSDLTAEGHGLEVDNVTLSQLYSCASEKGKVTVKLDHGSGIKEACGYLYNFRIDGNKLRADWRILPNHPDYDHCFDLAEEMAECIGFSVSFKGKSQKVGNKSKARCEKLVSVDLVPTPAANPDGMFSAVDNNLSNMAFNTPPNNQEPTLGDIMDLIQNQGQQLEQIGQMVGEHQDAIAEQKEGFEGLIGELNEVFGDGEETGEEEPWQEEESYQDPSQMQPEEQPAGGGMPAEFAQLFETVNFLVKERNESIQMAQQQEADNAFSALNAKLEDLAEQNTQLMARCEAAETALKTAGANGVSVSQTGGLMSFESGESRFEQAVKNFEAQGSPTTTAYKQAMDLENGALYEEHNRNKRMFG